MSERTALYRLYGDDGQLLYIGISADPERRFVQHAFTKPWWREVARREVQAWFDSRHDARAAEALAIDGEKPRHNIRGFGKTPIRNFRAPDEEWRPALAKAKAEGRSLNSVIVAYLRRYISTPPRPGKPGS